MTRLQSNLHRLDVEPFIRSEIFFEDLRELLQQLVLEVSVNCYFMVLLKFLLCNLTEANICTPGPDPLINMY